MPMVIVGVLLLLAWFLELGPVGEWPWWILPIPFGLAMVWWSFADNSGLTQRRAMQRMDDRKQERRDRSLEALGLGTKRDHRGERDRSRADRAVRDKPADARERTTAREARPTRPEGEPARKDPKL
jgi:small Trp-rich protein